MQSKVWLLGPPYTSQCKETPMYIKISSSVKLFPCVFLRAKMFPQLCVSMFTDNFEVIMIVLSKFSTFDHFYDFIGLLVACSRFWLILSYILVAATWECQIPGYQQFCFILKNMLHEARQFTGKRVKRSILQHEWIDVVSSTSVLLVGNTSRSPLTIEGSLALVVCFNIPLT